MESKIRNHISPWAGVGIFVLTVLFMMTAISSTSKERTIRVLVVKEADSIDLSVQGAYALIDEQNNRVLYQEQRSLFSTVKSTSSGISIGGREYSTRQIAIEPDRDASITINKRKFRGHVTVKAIENNKLNVINVVDLEKYVKGVLYHEISHRWPIEVIKAQAVATRSYAIYSMQQNKLKDFDLTNDIYSQVYGGKNSERFRTGLGVDSTRGQVLLYKDKILPAFFHATCAGLTENVNALWNMDIAPLKSVVCPYCRTSPHFQWKRNFRLKDLQDKLNAGGYKLGLIKNISVLERNDTHRIKSLAITTRDGKTTVISGKDFRNIISPNTIRSNNYEIEMKGYFVDFYGKGWGHGVGLCQWGAYGMAQRQFDYKAILNHYYPGAKIVPIEVLDPS